MVTFHVAGTPAPKGSFRIVTRGLHRPRVLDDSPATTSWAAAVRRAAALHVAAPFVDQALDVAITFRLARPKGHRTPTGALRKSAPARPAVKPDIDKLLRTTFDAMEGVVFDGDSRIVTVAARKEYAGDEVGSRVGATITVREAA